MDLYLEYNSDLIITPNGSLQFAVGWDQVRERIIRSLVTNPALQLTNGTTTAPDYVFHPSYGIGLGELVDYNLTKAQIQELTRAVNQAVLADVAVDPSQAPQISVLANNTNTVQILVKVFLLNGTSGEVSFSLGNNPN